VRCSLPLEAKRAFWGTKRRAGFEPRKEAVRHRNGLRTAVKPTFIGQMRKMSEISGEVLLGLEY
jgi:hypothetical protein